MAGFTKKMEYLTIQTIGYSKKLRLTSDINQLNNNFNQLFIMKLKTVFADHLKLINYAAYPLQHETNAIYKETMHPSFLQHLW